MSVVDQLSASADVPAGTSAKAKKKSILQFELTAKKVLRKDLMHFSRQLAVFIKAGIPILDALEAIHEEMGNKFFRSILDDMIESLRAGSTFADAASVHSNAFPPYYLGILRSAELTGQLYETRASRARSVVSALAKGAVAWRSGSSSSGGMGRLKQ